LLSYQKKKKKKKKLLKKRQKKFKRNIENEFENKIILKNKLIKN